MVDGAFSVPITRTEILAAVAKTTSLANVQETVPLHENKKQSA